MPGMRLDGRWRQGLAALASTGALLLLPALARGGERRFQIDPAQDLADLARRGEVAVRVERRDGGYTVDASAVLRAELPRLLDAATDFERHVEMGMPRLRERHVVGATPGRDTVYVWSRVSGLGRTSGQYVAVRVRRTLEPAGAAGVEWELVPRQPGWPYEETSTLTRLQGSWYLAPLRDGLVYMRYRGTAVLAPGLADLLPGWLVAREVRDTARAALEALAREAGARPPQARGALPAG